MKNLSKNDPLTFILWVVAIISPFLFLPIGWAIFTLIFVSFLVSFVAIPVGLLVKPLIFKNERMNFLWGLLHGIAEAVVTILIGIQSFVPDNFIFVAFFVNAVNQYTRYERNKDKDELIQWYSLVITFVLFLILKHLTSVI